MAAVAPLVNTPLHAAGRPNSSFNQSTEICSSRIANGERTQLKAIWSTALVSHSAASAAGVPPPITKWKNRGPAERVAPSHAPSISARTGCRAGDTLVLACCLSLCSMGSVNAAVLPVPVCAPAMMSWPRRIGGMPWLWTGVGSV